MIIKHAQKEALEQINTTFKLSERGYGQGFHEGQMQERKYWKDKIKAKIEEYDEMIDATRGDLTVYGDRRKDICLEIKCVLQSLLEKEWIYGH